MTRNLTVFLLLIPWPEMTEKTAHYLNGFISNKQNKLDMAYYINIIIRHRMHQLCLDFLQACTIFAASFVSYS